MTTYTKPQAGGEWLSRPIASLVSLDWERAAYIALVLVSLVTRLVGIGDRVMSHDESLHTQYSYQYYNGEGYQHSPLMHGPSLFHITALSYWLFGASDASSRIPVALVGTLLVILPYFLRNWIGRVGALFASLILLISPYITYYSRYIRHDIYVITAAAIVFIAVLHYLRQRKDKYIWWFALGMALMFTTMETSFIYVAIFGSFLLIRLGARALAEGGLRPQVAAARRPLALLALALLLLLGGHAGRQLVEGRLAETGATATTTAEGFAADPAETAQAGDGGAESSAEQGLRWLQVGAVIMLAAALFQTARSLRPMLDRFPEFDLVVLFTTLTLPMASAFLVVLAGQDPLNYAFLSCAVPGQPEMKTLELFIARLGNQDCRNLLFDSGLALTTATVVATLAASVLVGIWWSRRRWLVAAAIFHGIFILLYTSFFSNPAGWASGMVGSLGYWLAQQAVRRANQPGFFYLIVLPLYEFLGVMLTLLAAHLWARKNRLAELGLYWLASGLVALLAFSLANWYANWSTPIGEERSQLPGVLAALVILIATVVWWLLVRRDQVRARYGLQSGLWRLFRVEALVGFISFLLWWWLATWAVYSLAGEKMAWLSSHFVLPMALLGGWYMGERLTSGNWREVRSGRFLALTVLTGLLLLSIFLTLRPVIIGTARLGGVEQENLRQLGLLLGSLVLTAAIGYFVWRRAEGLEVGTLKRAFILAGFGLLALLTVRFSYMAAFPNGDYVTEFLVYAHGAPATKREVLDMLEELSMRLSGDKGVAVGFDNDAAWPYLWYLRDYPNRVYFGDNPQRSITESPILIVGSSSWTKVEPFLGDDYESWTYTFLWWPMEEYRQVSWNAIFGDPSTAAAERRGLGNPEVRRALWDIFFYRDYTRYGEVFGGTYTAGEWPLRHDLKVYVRRDVLASLWDRGTIAVAAEPPPDPYAGKDLAFNPSQVIGSPGSQAGQLQTPRNVALGPDGLIYVADTGNHRIQVFDADGRFVRGWGTNGRGQGQFNEPWGLAVDDEFVYVADTWNHRLQKFSLDGDFVAEIGRSGTPAEGQIGGGLFFGPRDILMRPDGNLLVTDTGNHRLQLLDPNGNFLQAVGGPRPGSELGSFSEPVGLAAGPDGTAFVTDTWNGRIQQLSADLSPLTSWPVDAWFGQSTINKPYLATDEAGRLYVTDPEGYRVLIFDVAGAFLGRLGDYSTGSDGFGLPTGVAAGASGRIFVADAANGQILIFDDPLAAAPAGDG